MARKFLTFSYDDGVRQDIKLTALFRKYGMKATFNLNSGSFGHVGHINHFGFDVCFDKVRADEVKDIYDGFEIASHGVDHRNFNELTDEALDHEILDDVKTLEALSGKKVIGAAYPCGCFAPETPDKLRERNIVFCRTVIDTHTFALPEDFNLWHPTCHDNDERVFELARQFIDLKPETDSVFYIWGHAFELDKNDKDRWANMERLCDLLAGKDDIEYVTNGDIYNAVHG